MGLEHVENLVRPTKISEAWEEKQKRGHEARFLGGGLDLSVYAPPSIEALIDLEGLGLRYVRQGPDGLEIGAMATMTEVLESPVATACGDGLLARVLRQVASPLQRNMATFGGTLGSAHPWSDVVTVLLVLDAQVRVYDGQERTLALSEYLAGRAAGESPLLTEIHVPEYRRRGTGFVKYGRSGFDVSMLNCACSLENENDHLSNVRIAVGGTPALAKRHPRRRGAARGERGRRDPVRPDRSCGGRDGRGP